MGGSQTWTFSRIKTRMQCPYMEHLRYELEMSPIQRKDALGIGEAVHKGIETRSVEVALSCFDEEFPQNQHAADDLEVKKATVIAMLTGYFEQFPAFEEHSPELEFSLPMISRTGRRSRSQIIAGKIDDIVRMPDGDWVIEYKTASRLDGAYFDRLYVDDQITMYCYAAKRMGFNPVGVIYRVIRKPTIRQRNNESIPQYIDRLIQDYRSRPEYYFHERKLYRPQSVLKAFEADLYDKVRTFNRDKRNDLNYKNTSHCSNYGGCPYLPLCCGFAGAESMYERKKAHEELDGGEVVWD